jgi:hypothetical protein
VLLQWPFLSQGIAMLRDVCANFGGVKCLPKKCPPRQPVNLRTTRVEKPIPPLPAKSRQIVQTLVINAPSQIVGSNRSCFSSNASLLLAHSHSSSMVVILARYREDTPLVFRGVSLNDETLTQMIMGCFHHYLIMIGNGVVL